MKKWVLYLLISFAALLVASPPVAFASSGEQAAVGYCSDIISSLTLPDYSPSTVRESELGRLVADAMRTQTGSELAIIAGGELCGGLPKGFVTAEDISTVLPDNHPVLMVEMTPAQLWFLLEQAVSHITLAKDETIDEIASEFFGFPQISGFSFEYDASQLPGSRLRQVDGPNGPLRQTDDHSLLSVAISQSLLALPEYTSLVGLEQWSSQSGTADLLTRYLGAMDGIDGDSVSRSKAVGITDNTLIGNLKILPFLPYALIVILLVSLPMGRRQLRNLDGSRSFRYRDYGDGNYDL